MLRFVYVCAALVLFGSLVIPPVRADGQFQEYENKPGCFTWNANSQPNATVTWTGECADERAIGYGTETWRFTVDGDKKEVIYTGEMRDGLANGRGVLLGLNGGRYEGEFKDDFYNGRGTLEFTDGGRYVGEFKLGLRHGRGVYADDSYRFEGDYFKGKRHGHGVSVWADGGRYEGGYRNDLQHGRGKYVDADYQYEGDFKDDKRDGQGKYCFSNGECYVGAFKNNHRYGRGVIITNDGERLSVEYTGKALEKKAFTD